MAPARHIRCAFTLIELLVVIAILAILASLLLPGLARAKARALRIKCLNNQKQMALVWQLYTDDNVDKLALNGNNAGGVIPSPQRRLWVLGDTHFFLPGMTDPRSLINPTNASFANYLTVPAIYKCPADYSTLKNGAETLPKIRSYAMNLYLGAENSTYPTAGYQIFKKTADFTTARPASIFLFSDVLPENLCFPSFVVNMTGTESFFHFPSSQHLNFGVLAFADGHAESHRWVDARTRPKPIADSVAHNIASPGNPDLAWIKARTTVPK